MICATCGSITSRIRVVSGEERCHACMGTTEAGSVRLDGVLARQRVRMDSVKHEGDVLHPLAYDKASRREVPNPEFVRRNPGTARNFLSDAELSRDYPKLARPSRAGERGERPFGEGDFKKEAQRVLSQT